MEHYVGLDLSLKLTAICVVDQAGKIKREGVVPSDPEAIATFIKSQAQRVARMGLETGATATWLWTELNNLGLPVICIDARHAKAVPKMQINKSDRNDAPGIARIMQCGWYRSYCRIARHAIESAPRAAECARRTAKRPTSTTIIKTSSDLLPYEIRSAFHIYVAAKRSQCCDIV
jgi:transposase